MGSLGTPCGKIRYKGQVPGCNSHCTYSEETEDAASSLTDEEEVPADVEEAPTAEEEEEAVDELEAAPTAEEDACKARYLPQPEMGEDDPGFEDLGEAKIDPEADACENPWEPYF